MNTTTKAIEATITGKTITLQFANGRMLEVDTESLSTDMQLAAMLHGLKQKLVDAAAMSRNPDTGRAATIDEKFMAVKEVFDRITGANPTWNKVAAGGGGGGAGGFLLRALMELYGKPRDATQMWLDQKSDAEKAALRKNAKIALKIHELQAQSGKPSTIDTEDLLSELGEVSTTAKKPAKK